MTSTAPETTVETDAEKKKRSDNLRKAYGEAAAELRTTHQEEFDALYVKHAAKYGIDYKPKPTKAEKARQALAALLSENPDLKEELVKEIAKKTAASETATPAPTSA